MQTPMGHGYDNGLKQSHLEPEKSLVGPAGPDLERGGLTFVTKKVFFFKASLT